MKYMQPPPKKTFAEKVIAQWPGIFGLGSIAAALGYVWYAKAVPPHRIYLAPVEMLIAIGVVLIGVWSFTG